MIIVHVRTAVNPDSIDAFINATLKNAQNSINEPGVIRFDFIQQADSPSNFLLIEIFKNEDAAAKHKQTPHYIKWRDAVETMMSQPRNSIKYKAIYPEEKKW